MVTSANPRVESNASELPNECDDRAELVVSVIGGGTLCSLSSQFVYKSTIDPSSSNVTGVDRCAFSLAT